MAFSRVTDFTVFKKALNDVLAIDMQETKESSGGTAVSVLLSGKEVVQLYRSSGLSESAATALLKKVSRSIGASICIAAHRLGREQVGLARLAT